MTPDTIELGTVQHKELFCQLFIETHVPYSVADIKWPELADDERRLLVNLPIWDDAVNTERETAVLVEAAADHELDALLARAVALQALEEARHSALVAALTERYEIEVHRRPRLVVHHPEWEFMKSGWGECTDSFFAFGVLAVAAEHHLVPPELLTIFDGVMQEEARHILFFENWRLYRRHAARQWQAPLFVGQELLAASIVVVNRCRMAASERSRGSAAEDQNFVLSGAQALGGLTPRSFVEYCLAENERRFAPYDTRLPRPRAVPAVARSIRRLLPDRPLGQVLADEHHGGTTREERARHGP